MEPPFVELIPCIFDTSAQNFKSGSGQARSPNTCQKLLTLPAFSRKRGPNNQTEVKESPEGKRHWILCGAIDRRSPKHLSSYDELATIHQPKAGMTSAYEKARLARRHVPRSALLSPDVLRIKSAKILRISNDVCSLSQAYARPFHRLNVRSAEPAFDDR